MAPIGAMGVSIGGATMAARRPRRAARDWEKAPSRDAAGKKNLLLLIQLRWIAVAGQIATIAVVRLAFGVAVPLVPMAGVILGLVILNTASLIRARGRSRIGDLQLLGELLFDVAALTVQLYLSGGGTNPFVSLYLLQVILGAVLLERWASWMIVAITSVCYLWLIDVHRALELPQHPGDFFNLHLHGMFVCFLLAAILLVFFISHIGRNLRERDANLARLREQAAAEDHIVRMGLLASGAAHELGTPLATLSVLLNDWQRTPALVADPELAQDIGSMQTQVARCKAILSDILLAAGEARGEGTVRTTVSGFLGGAVEEWRDSRAPAAVDYRDTFRPDAPILSDAALKHVIFNVFDNALEASPDWIGISVERDEDKMVVTVEDRGPGFAPEMLAEFGVPYASTKERLGSGVGLFLVCNVTRKLGGTVTAWNRGDGATVRLTLPLAALSPRGA